MKKKLLTILLLLSVGVFSGVNFLPVADAAGCTTATPDQLCNPISQSTVPGLIITATNFLLATIGVLAILFIIIGGLQYVTSAGNEENAKKGQKTITYAIIGLVVAILAFAIVQVVNNTINKNGGVGITTGTNPGVTPGPGTTPGTTPGGTNPPNGPPGPPTSPPNPNGNPGGTGTPPPTTVGTCPSSQSVSVSPNTQTVAFGDVHLSGGAPSNNCLYRIEVDAASADGSHSGMVNGNAGQDGDTLSISISDPAIFNTGQRSAQFTLTVSYLGSDQPGNPEVKFGSGSASVTVTSGSGTTPGPVQQPPSGGLN